MDRIDSKYFIAAAAIGLAIGLALHNLAVGIAMGVAMGLAIGSRKKKGNNS
ncbi:hypothetical protein [Mucilaginibacter celer]|uniref:hypothetical protein n=1 Tax=Mucilaginibacter celer TaxID=2305508 RepID=UPI0013CEEA41|nr:hypothetical protein [Mucilaginibacter celer]